MSIHSYPEEQYAKNTFEVGLKMLAVNMITRYVVILRKVRSIIMLKNNCIRRIDTLSSGDFNTFMKKAFIAVLTILVFSFQLYAQEPASLPRSNPEAEGVSSSGIISFLDAVANNKHEFHSFMMLRHGKVIAEGWWDPYRPDLKHTLYSASKSFTATAVGFAVAEKKLTVDDKVITFFPDDLPEKIDPYLSELRVKDLLSMSVGHQTDPTWEVASKNENWVRAFLAIPIIHEPGTRFLYNSVATYMLSAIVQKVTGERVVDYLKPRLFDPLGIQGMDWETDPRGVNTGGWGLRLKTEDMAKFGQLFLQKGMWQGKQILPTAWIEEATTIKIEQDPDAPQAKKDASDWLQGYCYQMWRSRHNSYRADGAYGQFIIIMPDQDTVVAITCETPDMQSELNLVWGYILPSIRSETLPADPDILHRLKEKLASLALPLAKAGSSTLEAKISDKTYEIVSDREGLNEIEFKFKNDICYLTLKTGSNTHQLSFGAGKWEEGNTTRYGPYLVSSFKGNRAGLPPFKVAGSYTWKDETTLELILRYIESPHSEKIGCHFDEEQVSVEFESSFNRSGTKNTFKGILQK
jgi:CubicO group peptidase (beta-lactamase class C family)